MKLNKLQKKLGISFKDDKLLMQALTHKSFDTKNNYEKLEFLGDRVLGFVISKKLLELYPNEKVGMIDKKLANLVNKNKCFEIGKELELDNYILTGNTEKKKKVNIEKKIISDCCESLIGAIYIDKGFEVSSKFILNYWKNYLNLSDITNTHQLGLVMYTDYILYFQLAGVILLLSMIGAILLTFRQRKGVKKQSYFNQISRNPSSSIELRNVESNKGVKIDD